MQIRSLLLACSACSLVGIARAEPVERLSFRDRVFDLAVHQDSVWAVGYPGMLLRSDDGGVSFTRVKVAVDPSTGAAGPGRERYVDEALFAIDFNSNGLGAIVGRSGTLLLTSDHGASWRAGVARVVSKPSDGFDEPRAPSTPVHLFGVDVLENGSIVAVGDFGTVLVSQDQGKSWQQGSTSSTLETVKHGSEGVLAGLGGAEAENEGEEARLSAVSFSDDKHGFVAGEFGWVLATEDGGLTWKRQRSTTDKLLFSILAHGAGDAIAVGSEGTVIETHDGGATWAPIPPPDGRHLFDVSCSGARCVISGQEGLVMMRDGAAGTFRPMTSEVLASLSAVAFVNGKDLLVAGSRGYVLRGAIEANRALTRVLGE